MMIMTQVKSFLILKLVACLIVFACLAMSQNENEHTYVEDACSVTRYHDLCIHSLASFSNKAKRNPSSWARAGVSITIREAKRVAQYLVNLQKNKHIGSTLMRGRNKIALSDCVECFQDTLDNLHRSLNVLRNLSIEEFSSQMEDVTTWVSAALTDEDTCMDGFGEQRGKNLKPVLNRVSNVTYMTSNALSLINKLATTGPGCLTN